MGRIERAQAAPEKNKTVIGSENPVYNSKGRRGVLFVIVAQARDGERKPARGRQGVDL